MADDDSVTAQSVDIQDKTPEEAAANFAQSKNIRALLDMEDEPEPQKAAPAPEDTPEKEEPADEPDDNSEEEEGEEAAEDKDESEQEETEEAEDEPVFELEDSDGTKREVTASQVAEALHAFQDIETQKAEISRRIKALEDKEADIPRQVSERMREQEDKLIEMTQIVSQLIQTEQPDPNLLDEDSLDYDPHKYQQQWARAEKRKAEIGRVAGEFGKITQRRMQEAEQYQWEQSQRLVEAWPDISKAEVRTGLYDFLSTNYGLGKEDVDAVGDHRLFLLARDAMSGSKIKTELPKVRAKVKALPPKPARKQARDTATGQFVKSTEKKARERLKNTGHIDDAAAAFMNLNL